MNVPSRNTLLPLLLKPILTMLRPLYHRFRREIQLFAIKIKHYSSISITFQCNICGSNTTFPRELITREQVSCSTCGSTLRFRSVIHALSLGLFGKSFNLTNFPVDPTIRGIGMSDWDGYAIPLAKHLHYVNTYYHQEPYLDIVADVVSGFELYDFIISSDVLEHVPAPVNIAFFNIFRLLKPGGVLILTVPYSNDTTIEHFPNLYNYKIQNIDNEFVLINTSPDGSQKKYYNLIFHGGPGTTLEMRRFGKADVFKYLEHAGFTDIFVVEDEIYEFGILKKHLSNQSVPNQPHVFESPTIMARRPLNIVIP